MIYARTPSPRNSAAAGGNSVLTPADVSEVLSLVNQVPVENEQFRITKPKLDRSKKLVTQRGKFTKSKDHWDAQLMNTIQRSGKTCQREH